MRCLPFNSICVLASLLLLLFHGLSSQAQTAPTFQITGATFGTTGITQIPAGVAGGTFQLTGTLPTAAQQAQTALLGCFYTGYGSTTGFPLSVPSGTNTEPLAVPASTIQSIPQTAFVATNNFAITGYLYFIRNGSVCDGTFDATLTNRYSATIIAPSISAYTGPISIPKTNTATNIASPPTFLSLPARGLLANGQFGATSASTVTFGTFGSVPTDLASNILHIAVPAAFSSSPVGTTATLGICNTFAATSVCTTPSPAVTLTVTALAPSTGTLTATPSPVTSAGQTVVTATFAKSTSSTANSGAPSGPVTFVAGATTLPPANLILDKTATFATQTTSLTIPTAATPVIAPTAGPYLNSVTVSITDATASAPIYYTQDGSTPTTSSTPYTGPFQITASQTVQAIAVAAGSLPSAVASAAYVITATPPAKLAFTVQPVNTATNTVITPAIKVAIQDANGNTVTNSSAPVTMNLQTYLGSPLQGTMTVNAVNGIATFSDLSIAAISTGYALVATSGSLASATSSAFNVTPYPITMTVQSALIGINSTLTGTITLGHAAPTGGLPVSLSSNTPANVTIAPTTLTIAAGQTTGSFTYTGVASGSATLSASATNYQTATASVTGTAAQVSLGTIAPVAPGQSVSLALSLPSAAPAGGTTVTFTSSSPGVATVTQSITVPAGQKTAAANPQVTGVTIGTTNILASAPGFAPATLAANVTVTASFNQNTYINLATSTTTTLNISAPAQAGGLTFTLTSDNPATATVPTSVTIPQGATAVQVPITGVADGQTTVRADSTGVTEATDIVYVQSTISVGNIIVGSNLYTNTGIYLPTSPPGPITVTITSSDPTAFTLATSSTAVGTASVTFTNITNSSVGTVYIQGHTVGAVANLKVSAPGYTSGSGTVTVYPSGFSYYPYYSTSNTTTTFSSPTGFSLTTNVLNPNTLSVYTYGQAISPGVTPVSIGVTSSDTTIGTIQNSPLTFGPGDQNKPFTFTPTGVGTATLTIGTAPTGFSNPSNNNTLTETVSAPAISTNAAGTAINLQQPINIYLPVAPPSGVTVTVTIAAPTLAVVSSSATVVGTSTITFTNVTSTYIGTIYFQGLAQGSTTYTVSAPGYTSSTSAVSIYPSGFSLYPYSYNNFSTTSFSGPTSVTVTVDPLTPTSLNVNSYGLTISPGVAPVNVTLSSSDTTVGIITGSPVSFGPGDANKTLTFTPKGSGTANVTVGTSPGGGYSTPANYQSIVATVTAPAISASNQVVGVNLQGPVDIYLPVSPPSGVAVTVTSGSSTLATISQSSTVAGTSGTTFTNVTGTYIGRIWIQGQATGSSTLSISAPGYTTGTATISIYPSGFSFYPYSNNISTTTFSSPTAVTLATNVLNPGSLTFYTYGQILNPGVTATLNVTSSVPSVGAISGSPIVFATGDTTKNVTFTPGGAGSTTLSITATPPGFSTSNNQTLSATVTAPTITTSNITLGVSLQSYVDIYLPQTPPNAVNVTVISNGTGIATLSMSDQVLGVQTQTFANVTGTYVGRIWLQGQALGSTTYTVSAPGYNNGSGTVTVYPSGFSFYPYQGNFTTSAGSSPYNLIVSTNVLNPGSLTPYTYGEELNPGVGPITISVTSSNTATGTITTSPLFFTTGSTIQRTTFTPLATGTSTLTVSVPSGFSASSNSQQITATVQ